MIPQPSRVLTVAQGFHPHDPGFRIGNVRTARQRRTDQPKVGTPMAVTKSSQTSPQFATDQPDTVSTVWSALTGGMFRVRLSDRKAAPGSRRGVVLDDSGNVIGDASDYIYGGSGFCIHTRAYGGYVPCDQIAFV